MMGRAHYYRALTLRDLQRTQEAIDEFDYFIKAAPEHARVVEAWEEKAFSNGQSRTIMKQPQRPYWISLQPIPPRPACAGFSDECRRGSWNAITSWKTPH